MCVCVYVCVCEYGCGEFAKRKGVCKCMLTHTDTLGHTRRAIPMQIYGCSQTCMNSATPTDTRQIEGKCLFVHSCCAARVHEGRSL